MAFKQNNDGFPNLPVKASPVVADIAMIADSVTGEPVQATLNSYPFLQLAGGTMTGLLVLSGDPVTALGAATRQYVDTVAAGFAIKAPVLVATTANETVTYNNLGGVGDTLTNAGAQSALTIDGVALAVNDRVLFKDQTSQVENGIWVVTNIGSGATNWVVERATDYDQAAEITVGSLVIVQQGTVNAVTSWLQTATVAVVGTDPIVFTQFSAGVGANKSLSNLNAVAINTALLPGADGTIDLGDATHRFRSALIEAIQTGTSNGNTLVLQAKDTSGGGVYTTFATLTAGNPPTMALASAVTATTQAPLDSSTKISTTAYTDAAVAAAVAAGANTALSNLAAVAINTSLVPGIDLNADLGSITKRWNNVYAQNITTDHTAGHTTVIGAWDVDGAAFTPFITLTANNTPTCALASSVTAVTQPPNTNNTTIATTAYVDATGAGTVTSVSGTLNRITSTGGATPVIDISAAYVGQTSITTLGTITAGTWNGSVIDITHGGTGVATLSTAYGTLVAGTTATGPVQTVAPGTSGQPLISAGSSAVPAYGILGLTGGGTNANLTASNGGIVYSDATKMQILSGTATARQMLQSGASAAPAWSTATYPATTTINRIFYSSATNVVDELATANNGTLVTSNTGAPSILAGPGVANNILMSQAAAAPIWSTATYPVTTTINQLLYSSAANTIAGLATANNGILVTGGTGIPSIGTAIPNGVTATTQAANDNSTKVATTAYCDAIPGTSGGLIKVATVTASSGATIDIAQCFTATYNKYRVVIEKWVPATNAVTGQMKIGTGAGPTWQATNYQGVGCYANNGAPGAQTSGTTQFDITLASRWSNTSTTVAGGSIEFLNINDATNNKTFSGLGTYKDSTGGIEFGWWIAGQWQSSTVLTSLRFQASSGNTTMTCTVYAYVN